MAGAQAGAPAGNLAALGNADPALNLPLGLPTLPSPGIGPTLSADQTPKNLRAAPANVASAAAAPIPPAQVSGASLPQGEPATQASPAASAALTQKPARSIQAPIRPSADPERSQERPATAPKASLQALHETSKSLEKGADPRASLEKLFVSLELPDENKLEVELAVTEAQNREGFSFRPALEKDGLLFVKEAEGDTALIQKNTLFPVDLVFLDEKGRITKVEENLPAAPPGTRWRSLPVVSGKAKYVLALAQGRARDLGLLEDHATLKGLDRIPVPTATISPARRVKGFHNTAAALGKWKFFSELEWREARRRAGEGPASSYLWMLVQLLLPGRLSRQAAWDLIPPDKLAALVDAGFEPDSRLRAKAEALARSDFSKVARSAGTDERLRAACETVLRSAEGTPAGAAGMARWLPQWLRRFGEGRVLGMFDSFAGLKPWTRARLLSALPSWGMDKAGPFVMKLWDLGLDIDMAKGRLREPEEIAAGIEAFVDDSLSGNENFWRSLKGGPLLPDPEVMDGLHAKWVPRTTTYGDGRFYREDPGSVAKRIEYDGGRVIVSRRLSYDFLSGVKARARVESGADGTLSVERSGTGGIEWLAMRKGAFPLEKLDPTRLTGKRVLTIGVLGSDLAADFREARAGSVEAWGHHMTLLPTEKQRNPYYSEGLLDDTGLPEESFDVTYVTDDVAGFNLPFLRSFLGELSRITVPGGCVRLFGYHAGELLREALKEVPSLSLRETGPFKTGEWAELERV